MAATAVVNFVTHPGLGLGEARGTVRRVRGGFLGSAFPSLSFTSFASATPPGDSTAMPPMPPPRRARYGNYCFRATCDMHDGSGALSGKVVGYDKNVHVAEDTERACRLEAGGMRGSHACSAAELVMVMNAPLECSGQIYFVHGTSTRRLV